MSLFVIVQRRKGNGQEYVVSESSHEGYIEYSSAKIDADAAQEDLGIEWEVFVGRVVPVEEAG